MEATLDRVNAIGGGRTTLRSWGLGMRARLMGAFLFCVTVVVYGIPPLSLAKARLSPNWNLKSSQLQCIDTVAIRLIPASLISEIDFDLDEFPQTRELLTIHHVDGHRYSHHPVGCGVLLAPLYFALSVTGMDIVGDDYKRQLVASVVASLLCALTVLTVYSTYAPRSCIRSLFVSSLLAFGTMMLSVCNEDVWMHTFGVFFMSVCVMCLERSSGNPALLGWMGLPAGLLFFVRPANGVLVAVLIVAVLIRNWRRLPLFGSLAAPFFLFTFVYNYIHFGNFIEGGYAIEHQCLWTVSGFPLRLLGLLISPARGLFVYSPLLMLSAAGFAPGVDRNSWFSRCILGALIVGHTALYASYSLWWGGRCYGPRFLIEILPAYAGLLWYAIPVVMPTLFGRALILLLFGFSVVANSAGYHLGSNVWDCQWGHSDGRPFWDLRDNPLSCFAFGLPPDRRYGPPLQDAEFYSISGDLVQFSDSSAFRYLGYGWTVPVNAEASGSEAELRLNLVDPSIRALEFTMRSEPGLPREQWVTVSINDRTKVTTRLFPDHDERIVVPVGMEDLTNEIDHICFRFAAYRRRSWSDIHWYAAHLNQMRIQHTESRSEDSP
jgi:hypothetical protein